MDKDNFFVKSEIESNVNAVSRFINTGVFSAEVLRPFREPVFVSLILKLDDLLQKFRILNHRLNFNDDITSGDITDLVNNIRNAICHTNSDLNFLDEESRFKFVFNTLTGKVSISLGDNITVKSDYDDDIAFCYGQNRIYLKRHILRIISESKEIYKKLYNKDMGAF